MSMLFRLKLAFFLFALFSWGTAVAQDDEEEKVEVPKPLSTRSVEKAYEFNVKHTGALHRDGRLSGYYVFYRSGFGLKRRVPYALMILDTNLNVQRTIEFEESDNIEWRQTATDGEHILIQGYYYAKSILAHRIFSREGQELTPYQRTLDIKSDRYYRTVTNVNNERADCAMNGVIGVPGKGFLLITPVQAGKKTSYEAHFIGTTAAGQWTYTPEEGEMRNATYLGVTDNKLVLVERTVQNFMKGNYVTNIISLDPATGRLLGTFPSQKGNYDFFPSCMTPDGNKGYFLGGTYFERSADGKNAIAQGLAIWNVDQSEKLTASYLPYLSPKHPDTMTIFRDPGPMVVHDISRLDDGSLQLSAEGFNHKYDVGRAALSAANFLLLGGMPLAIMEGPKKFDVGGIYMFRWKPGTGLMQFQGIDKTPNSDKKDISGFENIHTLGQRAMYGGWFDHEFTEPSETGTTVLSSFRDVKHRRRSRVLAYHVAGYETDSLRHLEAYWQVRKSPFRALPCSTARLFLIEWNANKHRIDLNMLPLAKAEWP